MTQGDDEWRVGHDYPKQPRRPLLLPLKMYSQEQANETSSFWASALCSHLGHWSHLLLVVGKQPEEQELSSPV